jgi:hypothetical protein
MTTVESRIGSVVIPLLPINRRTFDILRHELRALRIRTVNAVNPTYYSRVRRLRLRHDLSVNLGSGGKGLPNWINVDLTPHGDQRCVLTYDGHYLLPAAQSYAF